ncbi:adherence factor [Chlamydia sp. 04-14]|uniref:adherence factor n=1 Tax=Chlamydia TaxID=810 RepID=UPI002FC9C971
MSVNFFTSLSFSQHCLGEIAEAGKSILLEKLSGRLDELFLQRSEGVEVKALGPNRGLLCERVTKTDSLASLCLKVLLVLLIVPVIIALVLKIIVRLCLYLKYPGKVEEIAAPISSPKPILEPTTKPAVSIETVEDVVEVAAVPLAREEIIENFIMLPKLSQEQQNLLIESTALLNLSSFANREGYEEKGIFPGYVPWAGFTTPLTFELSGIPGLKFTYYPGYLATDAFGNQDIITSAARASDRFRERLGATADFLEGVPVTTDSTKEGVETLIKDGSKGDPKLGILNIEIFTVNQTANSIGENVGVIIEKKFD